MGDVVKEGELEDLRDRWRYAIEVAHYNGEPTPAGWEKGPIPIIRSRPERTWLWSDLHFSDRAALEAFGRPFRDVGRMNEHLVKEWQRCVRPGDTIICLGDVGHPNAWRDRRLVLDIRSCPGTRFLVLGNHDGDRDALREAGFTTQCTLALCATDPPLALSHVPLWSVPHGTINVHGHIHGGHEPTPAHINITIERLQYTPIGMTWLVADARRRRWITGG